MVLLKCLTGDIFIVLPNILKDHYRDVCCVCIIMDQISIGMVGSGLSWVHMTARDTSQTALINHTSQYRFIELV